MSYKSVILPELGEGVTEGELVKWLISEGESVRADQAVAEVMTDKASMEVPSPFDGKALSFLAREGDTLQVGREILKLSVSDGDSDKSSEKKKGAQEDMIPRSARETGSAEEREKPEPRSQSYEDTAVLATPLTRRLARELGVDIRRIKGSGLAGRVTREDITAVPSCLLQGKGEGGAGSSETALSVKGAESGKADIVRDGGAGFSIPHEGRQERRPLKGIRKKIAEKMRRSKAVIPHFTLLESAEVESLDRLKSAVKDMLKDRKIKVTYLSFVMKALLHTVREFPLLNAGIDDMANEVVEKRDFHFGFAVDTPRGLLVPVIKNVDKKSLAELSFELEALALKAVGGDIRPEEMSGGTVTITNIGSLGGEYATPIINAPESAILGMYRMYIKPCWDGSGFQPKKAMNFSLTCDHRLIDGAVAVRAMNFFIHKIENPLSLFI